MTTKEIFERYRRGEKIECMSLSEYMSKGLDVKQPSDLVANNPVMQKIIAKHWDTIVKPHLKK